MNMLFSALKVCSIVILTLLMSQVQVKGKRICDHVGIITGSTTVQKPIKMISSNFDFTDGKQPRNLKAGTTSAIQKNQDVEITNSREQE